MEFNSIFEQTTLTRVGIIGLEIFMLFMAVIYFIYTLVLSRRLKIMNQNLKTSYEKSFVGISVFHTIASVVAIALFLFSLIY